MAERLPEVFVQRQIRPEGVTSSVIFTLMPHALAALLASAGVERAGDLPGGMLQRLCSLSGGAATIRNLIHLVSSPPDGVGGIIVTNTITAPPHQAAAFAAQLSEDLAGVYAALDQSCNASTHPVDFELRVIDDIQAIGSIPWEEAGRTVLMGALFPPARYLET